MSQEADLINGGVGTSQGDLGCFVALPVRGLAVELPDFSFPSFLIFSILGCSKS